jgi:hypothetical protein
MRKLYALLLVLSSFVCDSSYAANARYHAWSVTRSKIATCDLMTNQHGFMFGFSGDTNQTLLTLKKANWKFARSTGFTLTVETKFDNGIVYEQNIPVMTDHQYGLIHSVDTVDAHDFFLPVTISGKTVQQVTTTIKFASPKEAPWVISTLDAAYLLKAFDDCVIKLRLEKASLNEQPDPDVENALADDGQEEDTQEPQHVITQQTIPTGIVTGFPPTQSMTNAAIMAKFDKAFPTKD